MNIEKLNLSKITSKGIVIGIVIGVSIIIILNLLTSKAKYQNTESINIAKGTISYSASDLDIVAMYKIEDEQETPIDQVPGDGYILNNKTNCKVKDVIDQTIKVEYVDGKINISDMSKKGTKCYIYFEEVKLTPSEQTLANLNLESNGEKTEFTGTAETDEGIFSAPDGMYGGTSYYWRGAVEDNYVHFAGFYWRIIRINGDGTLRLIYDGKQAYSNDACLGLNCLVNQESYNLSDENNLYVGFKYENSSIHGVKISSTVLEKLYNWYKTNIADRGYDNKVDQNGLFCNDRNATTNSLQSWEDWLKIKTDSGGTGTIETYYGAYMRLSMNSATPTLNCENDLDVFSKENSSKGNGALIYPVGLITADETLFAGGWYGIDNKKYYLYSSIGYWTMTPSNFTYSAARVFYVTSTGFLNYCGVDSMNVGIRPVINLRSDIEFKADTDGTINNPYEVI